MWKLWGKKSSPLRMILSESRVSSGDRTGCQLMGEKKNSDLKILARTTMLLYTCTGSSSGGDVLLLSTQGVTHVQNVEFLGRRTGLQRSLHAARLRPGHYVRNYSSIRLSGIFRFLSFYFFLHPIYSPRPFFFSLVPVITLLELQSRFGDNWEHITWNLSGLSP